MPQLIERSCETCDHPFLAPLKETVRGNGRFCSRSCSSARPRKLKLTNAVCGYCDNKFYCRPSRIRNSKSGLLFCCRSHKDIAHRLNGITDLHPPHYGTGTGQYSYREQAWAAFQHICNRCRFNDERILVVHHLDRNRKNNALDNLEILCPNCHAMEHYVKKR